MPVTAKLSRRFYETFGDEVTNELVEWFNQVDATYRADLRELNELNFARFDAKLEQRIAELRTDFKMRLANLDAKLEQRVAELRTDFEMRLANLDAKLKQRVAELRAYFEKLLAQLDATLRVQLQQGMAALDAKIDRRSKESIKWMFAFWTGTVIPLAALFIALIR